MAKVFVAPLRQAVLLLARKGQHWTVDAMATHGRSTEHQAKAYASRLCDAGVLTMRGDGMYQPGPDVLFMPWVKRHPKTKPGGNRRERYRAVTSAAM